MRSRGEGHPSVSVNTKKKELVGDFQERRARVAARGVAGGGPLQGLQG